MESRKVLITGISGMVGSTLADRLVELGGYEIHGVDRHYDEQNYPSNLVQIKDQIKLVNADLNNREKVLELIGNVKPDLIFHLAADFAKPDTFETEVIVNNVNAETNIFEGVKAAGIDPKILVVSSSQIYGDGNIGGETDEDCALLPRTMYALSKVGQDLLAYKYGSVDKLKIVRARPFNHAGARRSPEFVESAFARQVVQIERDGGEGEIRVGNLGAFRDWMDVRDVVEAYLVLIDKGVVGDAYNVCAGVNHQVQELLDKFVEMSKVEVKVVVDPALVRKSEDHEIMASNKKLKALGWDSKYSFEDMCQSVLDYWRENL